MEARLTRRQLHARDLSDRNKIVLTQEAMAQTIGARRKAASREALALTRAILPGPGNALAGISRIAVAGDSEPRPDPTRGITGTP